MGKWQRCSAIIDICPTSPTNNRTAHACCSRCFRCFFNHFILGAGNAGVAVAARVAASAALIPVSLTAFADSSIAPAEAKGIPRQAGKFPINTLGLPGPPVNTGGRGWATAFVILAAALPIQKLLNF